MNRKNQSLIVGPIEGYKMVDANMTCRDFTFEIGKRHELPNNDPLELCKNGFHFCKYPSGVWAYYSEGRMFKARAYGVLQFPDAPGADYKLVCESIELYEEVFITGYRNTGNRNTGNRNTGNRNTGDWNTGNRNTGSYNTGNSNTGNRNTGSYNTGNRNTGNSNTGNSNTGDCNTGSYNTGSYNTGDCNTGDCNTGSYNTGNRNTGDCNTGNRNTGDCNTGYSNTGDCNTGSYNTGNSNTGDRNTGSYNTGSYNTGNSNTGDGNCGDNHAGSLCYGKAPFFLFNKMCKREDVDFNAVSELSRLMLSDDLIDPTPFLHLPGATKTAIKKLHDAHIKARKEPKL